MNPTSGFMTASLPSTQTGIQGFPSWEGLSSLFSEHNRSEDDLQLMASLFY
jgi:hypothetical protein